MSSSLHAILETIGPPKKVLPYSIEVDIDSDYNKENDLFRLDKGMSLRGNFLSGYRENDRNEPDRSSDKDAILELEGPLLSPIYSKLYVFLSVLAVISADMSF